MKSEHICPIAHAVQSVAHPAPIYRRFLAIVLLGFGTINLHAASGSWIGAGDSTGSGGTDISDAFNNWSAGFTTGGFTTINTPGTYTLTLGPTGTPTNVTLTGNLTFDSTTFQNTTAASNLSVTAGGTGYASAPTVTFNTPTGGSAATGTATVSGGAVTGVAITAPGSGYYASSVPTVSFGGPGTGAAATFSSAGLPQGALNITFASPTAGSPVTLTLGGASIILPGRSDSSITFSSDVTVDLGSNNVTISPSGTANQGVVDAYTNVTFNGAVTSAAAGTQSLTINNPGNTTFNGSVSVDGGVIINNGIGTGKGVVTMNGLVTGSTSIGFGGAGILYLNNNSNNYTGTVTLPGFGTLNATSIANFGVASALGAPTSGAIQINNATLNLTPSSNQTSNRTFSVSNTGFLNSNGTGTLSLSGAITFGTTNALLVLSGTNTGTNTLNGGVLSGGFSGTGIRVDGGTWALGSSNTYTGPTTLNRLNSSTAAAAVLQVGSIGSWSVGNTTASGLGTQTSAAASQINLSGGTLQYVGAGETTNRNVSLGNTSGSVTTGIDSSGTGALVFSGGAFTVNANDNLFGRGFVFSGTNTNLNNFALNITNFANSGSGANGLFKTGAGTWELSGANTFYSPKITISGGILAANTLDGAFSVSTTTTSGSTSATVASATGLAIGQGISGTNIAAGTTITNISGTTLTLSAAATGTNTQNERIATPNSLGLGSNANTTIIIDGGTLQYLGAATTTDRLFQVGASTAGSTSTIDASGTGAVNFANTGNLGYGTNNQARNLVLTGTNTGANTFAPLIANNGTGITTLTKSGTGNWVVSGANTYTGATGITGGTLSISSVATGATAQNLGKGATVNLGVAGTSSGALQYTGAVGTLDKTINVLGNGSDTIQNSGTGLLTLSGSIVKNGTTLTLNGGANGIKVTGVISGSSANSDLNVTGGVTDLNNLNTYNGPTWIYGGGTLQNDFAGGALPTGTTVNIGTSGTTTGGAASAGVFDLYGNNQTIAGLNTTGTGSHTSDVVTNSGGTSAANSTLTVTGGGTFAGVIQNGAKTTALTVTGGTLTLSGTNTYTGATTVSGGTLNVTGSISNSAVSVANGATLGGTGSIGGLTLANGSNINLQDGATNTLSGTTLSLPTGTGTLSIDVGSGTSTDLIGLTGAATLGGSFTVNVNGLTGATIGNSYTIVTATGGLTLADFNAGTLGGTLTGDTLNFSGGGTSIVITISGPLITTNYYFTGATSNDFTMASNYKTAFSGGSVQSTALSSTSDVFIAASSTANLPPTIGTNNPTINSLTFTSTGAGTSLNGTGTVLIVAGSGSGITDSAGGTGTETVNANVALGANQTWTNSSSTGNTLAVAGVISQSGGSRSLTVAGPGAVNFTNGSNTYTGGTTVNSGGKLFINNTSGISALGTGALVVQRGATFGGAGVATGLSSFDIGSVGSGTSTVQVGDGTDSTSSLTLGASAPSNIANANLTFNLNSANSNSNSLITGTTGVTFGSSVNLTLTLQGSSIINGTSYVLIDGTGTGTGANGSTFSGITTFTNAQGKLQISGGLTYNFTNAAGFYLPSYLYLDTTNDNIDIQVVPEPSTWAMMLGGLALLVFWQRRRNKLSVPTDTFLTKRKLGAD